MQNILWGIIMVLCVYIPGSNEQRMMGVYIKNICFQKGQPVIQLKSTKIYLFILFVNQNYIAAHLTRGDSGWRTIVNKKNNTYKK